METNSLMKETVPTEVRDGKHLVFLLEERGYGIPIMDVSEINGIVDITPVPKTPNYIKGIINLRGKIIPVMDLRLKFGMPPREYDEQTCIVIVNIVKNNVKKQIGVIVDTVSEVFNIPTSEIEPPPTYGTQADDGFLNGIGKVKDKVVMLLNIEKVVYSEEIIKMLYEKETESEVSVEKTGRKVKNGVD